ncbi:two-component system response regulator [uncultured Desulfobacter sp.]|uniref:two-component system response regulator n=1 Tax=uncultured Desulfobacter sp. TaxID=240139 RepID=UPI002AAB464E|nr:two-component system response regulator [uncultured Desulfobacter sp.]
MIDKTINSKIVLIVDDTPDNLTILGELLMPDYQVRVANSGPKALVAAATTPLPDLILLDIMMPGMDGYEVIRHLKSNPDTSDIPVIFITALDTCEDEAKGLQLGASDYISKPIRAPILLARVKGQLEIKAARDILRNQNSWLETEIRRRINQYQKVQDISMRALACLAEARDNETGNHILRTQNYLQILAEELAGNDKYTGILTDQVIDVYTKAAPLHDIGKVGIPDHVLYKPAKHTQQEWEIMKTHAQIGADAIWRAIGNEEDKEAVNFLYVAMDIAGSHHEKWDGSGYPRGLDSTRIPLSARLMALADVFDALVSHRVYKPAYPMDVTVKIINDGSGTHFDPDIVAAFNRRVEDFQDIASLYIEQQDPEMASSK